MHACIERAVGLFTMMELCEEEGGSVDLYDFYKIHLACSLYYVKILVDIYDVDPLL